MFLGGAVDSMPEYASAPALMRPSSPETSLVVPIEPSPCFYGITGALTCTFSKSAFASKSEYCVDWPYWEDTGSYARERFSSLGALPRFG